jgi:tRNA(His) guanylyltransferase
MKFEELDARWQRRGTGFYWRTYEIRGTNPKTGEQRTALRRGVHRDEHLPTGDVYAAMLSDLLTSIGR